MPNDAGAPPPNQNQNPPQKNANEASAADLLSLWGGGTAKPAVPSAAPKPLAPEPAITPKPTPAAPEPVATPPPMSTPPPPAPAPAPPQTSPPAPRPASTPTPEVPKPTPPVPPAAPKPEPSPAALPKPAPQKAEASAADLLSLWGTQPAKPTAPTAAPKPLAPEPAITPKPVPAPPMPASPPPRPIAAPAPMQPPTSAVPPRPAAPAPQPASTYTPPPRPTPTPAPIPPPVAERPTPLPPQTPLLPSAPELRRVSHEAHAIPPRPPEPPRPTYTPPPPRPEPQRLPPKPEPKFEPHPPPRPASPPPPKTVESYTPPPQKPSQPEKPKLTTEPLETKKKPPPEAIEGELVGQSKAVPEADDQLEEHTGGFGSQLDEFLEELHLSRRHLLYGAGCLILLIVFIFGGMAAFRYWKNLPSNETAESSETEESPEVPTPGITDEETGVTATKKMGDLTHDDVGDTGLLATLSAGRQDTGFTPLAEYLLDFRRLENAYDTNINQLLDAATDRRARFQSYLILMKSLLKKAYENVLTMDRELVAIENTYNPIRDRQAETDKNFFQEVRALNGKTAEDLLEEFIKASREVVTLRARFKAVQEIRSYFVQAIPKLEARIKDIELNEEPLVSGIKVYDVRGSDVELIVPVNSNTETLREEPLREGKVKVTGTTAAETSSSASPPSTGVPFLPVHPSQVDTGADYITAPGGGF